MKQVSFKSREKRKLSFLFRKKKCNNNWTWKSKKTLFKLPKGLWSWSTYIEKRLFISQISNAYLGALTISQEYQGWWQYLMYNIISDHCYSCFTCEGKGNCKLREGFFATVRLDIIFSKVWNEKFFWSFSVQNVQQDFCQITVSKLFEVYIKCTNKW